MTAPPRHRRPQTGLDSFYPRDFEQLPISWNAVRIPALPQAFALTKEEQSSQNSQQRYRRRTIQCLSIDTPADLNTPAHADSIAFIDKALPHATYDLMAGEVGDALRPTVSDIGEQSLAALLRACERFVAFVSEPDIIDRYGLQNGLVHFPLNCDPNTGDRESCQAIKQFHLHYIYWTAAELQDIDGGRQTLWHPDVDHQRRRVLDPLMSLAARMLHQRLSTQTLCHPQAELLPFQTIPDGEQAGMLGCLLRLPNWQALTDPSMPSLLVQIHYSIANSCSDLLRAFSGRDDSPPKWQRHPLLPCHAIAKQLPTLGFSTAVSEELRRLALLLHSLSGEQIDQLRHRPRQRIQHLSLNPPSYALNIHSPARNRPDAPLIDADAVYLIIQPKLFSAVGGAGSLSLAGVPSVYINRAVGHFSEQQWHKRAAFQRQYLQFCQPQLQPFARQPMPPVRALKDLDQGWR